MKIRRHRKLLLSGIVSNFVRKIILTTFEICHSSDKFRKKTPPPIKSSTLAQRFKKEFENTGISRSLVRSHEQRQCRL